VEGILVGLYQNPVFRRTISPWYDTEIACIAVAIVMFLTFLFGVAGISVARSASELWIPLLITLLSAEVLVSTAVRLVRRYTDPGRQVTPMSHESRQSVSPDVEE